MPKTSFVVTVTHGKRTETKVTVKTVGHYKEDKVLKLYQGNLMVKVDHLRNSIYINVVSDLLKKLESGKYCGEKEK